MDVKAAALKRPPLIYLLSSYQLSPAPSDGRREGSGKGREDTQDECVCVCVCVFILQGISTVLAHWAGAGLCLQRDGKKIKKMEGVYSGEKSAPRE